MERNILRRYLVAGPQDFPGRSLVEVTERLRLLLNSGITTFQFRDKGAVYASVAERLAFANQIRQLADEAQVMFIMNDDVTLAKAVNADGLHIGQADTRLVEARQDLPASMLIGLSVRNAAEMQAAQASGADYLGVGPIFPTRSKSDAAPALGIDGLVNILALNELPSVGIGGIAMDNLSLLSRTSLDGVAVISMLTRSRNLDETIDRFKRYW